MSSGFHAGKDSLERLLPRYARENYLGRSQPDTRNENEPTRRRAAPLIFLQWAAAIWPESVKLKKRQLLIPLFLERSVKSQIRNLRITRRTTFSKDVSHRNVLAILPDVQNDDSYSPHVNCSATRAKNNTRPILKEHTTFLRRNVRPLKRIALNSSCSRFNFLAQSGFNCTSNHVSHLDGRGYICSTFCSLHAYMRLLNTKIVYIVLCSACCTFRFWPNIHCKVISYSQVQA